MGDGAEAPEATEAAAGARGRRGQRGATGTAGAAGGDGDGGEGGGSGGDGSGGGGGGERGGVRAVRQCGAMRSAQLARRENMASRKSIERSSEKTLDWTIICEPPSSADESVKVIGRTYSWF
jgi:hypothetical protein